MKDLKGKNALLTGGSKGLGPQIARFLAKEGVNLALTARTEKGLRDTAKDVSNYNVNVKVYPGDITDQSFRKKLLEDVKNDFSRLDILINNAGMEWVSSYTALTPDYIEKMIQTNLIAAMLLTRLALPDMLAQRSGQIVNMSSLGGKRGNPYGGTYCATKAGLIEWTKGLRMELAGSGVGVSVICPGFVFESGMFAEYNKKPPWISNATTPEKVAEAVIRAIKKDIGEIAVNPGPTWLIPLLDAIHPGMANWLYKIGGVYEFYRKQAEENEAKPNNQ
ncbi:MAG: SDR family NAD(P)-dependent oxidoreductase [Desulfobacteraceae bacterium]|nr:SDR family NAD(P)-dependent oxidoreductase [Desulfobacteraceae bacterium]MBC2755647.1 SDR family NAD(P)-dependent oxidoreductase [Desulfobacteraceae bacterium]